MFQRWKAKIKVNFKFNNWETQNYEKHFVVNLNRFTNFIFNLESGII